jgi:ABC-2 type transport system permease protein
MIAIFSRLSIFLAHGLNLARSYRLNFAARYVSTLVSVVFFYFLDQMFRTAGVMVVEGGDYFTFLLIGNAISRYLELGMRAFAETLRDEMLRGTIEPLLVTATPTVLALLGPSVWMLVEGTLLVLAQFGVGALLGADFARANWVSALIVSLTSLACLLCYGILSAAFTLVFKRSDPINWLTGVIAYVFSGVFFPISILPPALRLVSYVLPFTYAVRALRGALMLGSGLAELGRDLLALLAFTAVLLPLSLWAMDRAVRHLKVTGELSHY